ncbi:MAG: hypothetical protein J6S96_09620 [Muribaculaceae bacterium]|nr:hypothetical protein [Muribaculaceae bacterium]
MSETNKFIKEQTQRLEATIDNCAKQSHDRQSLLLVSGDMSGIQPFLYQIVSSKAAKNLKGRSCYIDLLGKAVVRSLLKALSLTEDYVICESGGTFVLVAPNIPDITNKLDNAIRLIEKKIFETHGTALSVSIDSVEITSQEAKGGTATLAQRWNEVFAKRELKKNAKCSSRMLDDDGYRVFFQPSRVSGNKTDAVTGEDIADVDSAVVKDFDDSSKDLVVSKVNKTLIELGECLRDGCIPKPVEDNYKGNDFVIEPAGLGIKFRLVNDGDATEVKTFEKMCENADEDALERLGVLRMDVDNLGSKFQEYARTQSLVAYSALSRELDEFFKKDVYKLCCQEECYLLYGGGDDLFVVGEWRNVIKLATNIQDKFKQWAKVRNGDWSLSGGVAIVKAKYPIIEGAKESGEEEDNAKNHNCDGLTKNSISLMGTPLNWDKEFEPVIKLKDRVVQLLSNKEKEVLPKSFLNKVMMHASKASIKSHKVTDVSIYWQLTYDIKRALERAKNNEDVKDLLDCCRKDICTPGDTLAGEKIVTNYHLLELWALACRWAELEYRSNKE